MTGAESVARTAADAGVRVCFCNPGTTELPLVSALSHTAEIRMVLGLAEAVLTGAADGYGRVTRSPALTLMHQGPGLANGLSNLHNASRARSPIVNLVGMQPTWHEHADPPLSMPIDALARVVSGWTRTSTHASQCGTDVAEAIAAACGPPGRIATLMLPADAQWEQGAAPAPARPSRTRARVADDVVRGAVERLLSGSATALLLGGPALSAAGVTSADRIARATGCQLLCESFPALLAYGRSRPQLARLPYFADAATELLRHVRDVLLVGCDAPVAFFGYPDGRSDLIPPNVRVHRIASADKDAEDALQMLADELRASTNVAVSDEAEAIAAVPSGRLTPASLCATIAAILPEHAIVIDEGMSAAGIHLQAAAASAPHTYMALTGGACGMALASAIGAAIAAPDARVVTLVGDGSAMYTPQALWTQARESLDITNVVIANRGYRLLQVEYAQLQQERPDASARAMLELTSPEIEWVSVARGFGLPASRVDSIESLADRLRIGVRERGPSLIEVVL